MPDSSSDNGPQNNGPSFRPPWFLGGTPILLLLATAVFSGRPFKAVSLSTAAPINGANLYAVPQIPDNSAKIDSNASPNTPGEQIKPLLPQLLSNGELVVNLTSDDPFTVKELPAELAANHLLEKVEQPQTLSTRLRAYPRTPAVRNVTMVN